jgi:SAM-dependent methyltransferase
MAPAYPPELRHFFDHASEDVRQAVRSTWKNTPFVRMQSVLPLAGLIVDFGSGYGLWPSWIAIKRPDCQVIGLEASEEHAAVATHLAQKAQISNLAIRRGRLSSATMPAADLLTMVDYLHQLPLEKQGEALMEAIRRLTPDGRLLVKELDRGSFKFRFASRPRSTSGAALAASWCRSSDGWLDLCSELGLTAVVTRLDRGRSRPHIMIDIRTAPKL